MASTSIDFDIIARDMASAKLRRVGGSADSVGGKIGRLGGRIAKFGKVAALGFAAAAAGGAIVGKKLIDAGEAASTSNARIDQIAKSMGLFGKQADKTAARIVKMSEKQALATGVNQNAVKEANALLLTFKNVAKSADEAGGTFDRTSRAVQDLVAAGYGDLSSTSKQVGKALNDPIKGLSGLARAGVQFTDKQKGVITALAESGQMGKAQDLILKELEKQVGGTAKATANASDRMKVAFSQVAERLGTKLLPYFEKFTDWTIKKGLPAAEKFAGWLQDKLSPAFSAVGDGAKKVWGWLEPKLGPAMDKVRELVERLRPEADGLATTWREKLANAVDAVKQAFQDAQPFIKASKEILEEVGPIARDVVYPALKKLAEMQFDRMVKGIKIAGKVLGAFGDLMVMVWNNQTQPALKFMADAISTILRKLGEMFTTLGSIKGAPAWIGKTGEALQRAADKAQAVGDNIKKIPRNWSTDYKITTFYRAIGQPPKGGPGQGAGVLLPRSGASGGGASGSPSGRSVTSPSGRMSASGGSGVTAADIRAALEGMAITLVDGDAGRRAIMAVPGAI